MIQIHESYLIEADANTRMADLYKFYPKEGYGTTLSVRYNPNTCSYTTVVHACWVISGYRESSCD